MDIILSEVKLMFNLDTITSVDVSNNWLYIVVGPNSCVRINLDSPQQIEGIKIPSKHHSRIHKIFTNQQGDCVLAITEDYNHFFYSSKYPKLEFQHISKLQSTPTISVVFHPVKPGLMYLGTQDGKVLQLLVDVSSPSSYFKRDLKSLSLLWKGEQKDAIAALFCKQSELFVVLGPKVLSLPLPDSPSTPVEAPVDRQSPPHTQPHVLCVNPLDVDIKSASISPSKHTIASVLNSETIGILNTSTNNLIIHKIDDPQFTLCTDHHIIVISPHEITTIGIATSKITKTLAIDLPFNITGVSVDIVKSTFWLFTSTNLYEIRLDNELNGMYKVLVNEEKYEEALKVANTNAAKSFVMEHYGNNLLKTDCVKAAKLLGKSDCNLETAVLKIIGENPKALSTLLFSRLKHTTEKSKQVILTSWLAQIGEIDITELVKYEMRVEIVQNLLISRGDYENFIRLCLSINDLDSALQFFIARSQFQRALELIRKYGIENPDLVYKYASVFMFNCASDFVTSLMKLRGLNVVKLLPALISYHQLHRGGVNYALVYMRHVFNGNASHHVSGSSHVGGNTHVGATDTTGDVHGNVHGGTIGTASSTASGTGTDANAEVSLTMLSMLSEQTDESEVFDFVINNHKNFRNYDFALRTLLETKHFKSAIHLYVVMNLFEEAVLLCLKVGGDEMIDLAVNIADLKTGDNEELRKNLLITISKYTVEREGPQAALKFVNLLNIGDLLVQFPEFETINALSPEVVKSLEQTKSKLIALNAEIDESLRAGEEIRLGVNEFKRGSVLVEPGEPCSKCAFPLLSRKFVVFPCQHGFHLDCDGGSECSICAASNVSYIEMPLSSEF